MALIRISNFLSNPVVFKNQPFNLTSTFWCKLWNGGFKRSQYERSFWGAREIFWLIFRER